MGYGGEGKNSGIVTKLSNDGGIDGIIKEDILGFNHISIQAKRYALDNNVQRHEVQSFVGAVAGTPSKKGVFITTSDYTKGAMEYVESLNGSPTIILINGQQLTEYIYDYGLGLQTEKVLKVMKMDMDYWDAMDNAWWYCSYAIFLSSLILHTDSVWDILRSMVDISESRRV